MTSVRNLGWLILCFLGVLCVPGMAAESISKAPANVQVALVAKLLAYNKTISKGGNVIVHVVGDGKIAAAMKPAIGRSVGKSKLSNVVEGPIPADKVPDLGAIFVGKADQWPAIQAYCCKHKIMSVSGLPELVGKGVSLIVGASNNKPKVILDIAASKQEGINWDPKILKIATLINK
ncbi:YfiR/HmsC family protein [Planctomycetota bacterium]